MNSETHVYINTLSSHWHVLDILCHGVLLKGRVTVKGSKV